MVEGNEVAGRRAVHALVGTVETVQTLFRALSALFLLILIVFARGAQFVYIQKGAHFILN